MALSDYELRLPYALWTGRDWSTAIQDADGFKKRVLQIQERAVHAVAGLDSTPTSPETLALSVLWVRGYLLLQSALDLRGAWSVRAADLLTRAAFELCFQVEAIVRPVSKLASFTELASPRISVAEAAWHREWSEVSNRLRGFAAWALTNDLEYFRNRSRSSELDRMFAGTDPALLPTSAEEKGISMLFGELEIVSAAEAAVDRVRARNRYEGTIARIMDWLRDPRFDTWTTDKLRPWIEREQQSQQIPSLYETLDSEPRSTLAMLREIGLPHLYAAYSRGSMLLHGSSIEQFIVTSTDRDILPLVHTNDEEAQQICDNLAKLCNIGFVQLLWLRRKCVPTRA